MSRYVAPGRGSTIGRINQPIYLTSMYKGPTSMFQMPSGLEEECQCRKDWRKSECAAHQEHYKQLKSSQQQVRPTDSELTTSSCIPPKFSAKAYVDRLKEDTSHSSDAGCRQLLHQNIQQPANCVITDVCKFMGSVRLTIQVSHKKVRA